MAEAGEAGDNPFSFKSFMKRASTDVSLGEAKGPQEKMGKNAKASNKKKASSGDVLFPEDSDQEKEDKDNPFSFSKFVKTKKTKKSSQTRLVGANSKDSGSDLDDLFGPAPSSSKDTTKGTTKPPPTKDSKPKTVSTSSDPLIKSDIFESDSDSSFGLTEEDSLLFKKSSDTPIDLGPPLTSVPDTRALSNGRSKSFRIKGNKDKDDSDSFGSSLEDGSKEAIQALDELSSPMGESAVVRKRNNMYHKLQLKAENEQLKSELLKSQQETKKHKEKNSSLKEELKSLKKKESEDTKALEDMVQRVESNLVATTKRAVSAEATISKLKQEVQSLQIQLAQATPQSVQQKYEEMLRGVREKANFASMQLLTATQKADQSIRDLLSGADTLKNVAQILTFIDSTTEIKEESNT